MPSVPLYLSLSVAQPNACAYAHTLAHSRCCRRSAEIRRKRDMRPLCSNCANKPNRRPIVSIVSRKFKIRRSTCVAGRWPRLKRPSFLDRHGHSPLLPDLLRLLRGSHDPFPEDRVNVIVSLTVCIAAIYILLFVFCETIYILIYILHSIGWHSRWTAGTTVSRGFPP